MNVWTVLQSQFECVCKITLESVQCVAAARAEFMTAHTNLPSGNWSCSSCNNGTPRGVSRDGFSGLRVLWKKSSNHTQGAGALLLLKQLFLPSEKPGEGYMCIRAFKISLCVCKYIYRLWMFYLHPLKPEHVITKQYKFCLLGARI